MKKIIIVANWKMNPATIQEAKKLFSSVEKGIKNIKKDCPKLSQRIEVVICPPFLYLPFIAKKGLVFGSQDCFWEKKGAYTGEISPKMLKNLGCQYVILGHSERRRHFGETETQINKKIKAVILAKLSPILCIGENEKEREEGQIKRVLEKQLSFSLKGISQSAIRNSQLIVAYEPVWAISTSKHRKDCPPEEIHIMSLLLRKILAQKYGSRTADKIRILFGGNVNSQNTKAYFDECKVQGFLVGGASLNAGEFIKIIKQLAEARPPQNCGGRASVHSA